MSEFEEKVLDLLKKIDGKLDKVLEAGSKAAAPAPRPAAKVEIISQPSVKPSAVVDKQEEAAATIEKPQVEGRRICPKCKGVTFNAIEDKSKILHQMGGVKIYAKKYICKSCGHEM